jgi:hypothetical protein
MWKHIIKAVLTLSHNPAVQQWVRRRARIIIDRIRNRAEKRIAGLYEAAGLDPAPKPKLSRMIRTDKDILHPGQVAIVDGKAYRVVRLISSSAAETVYEGIEA